MKHEWIRILYPLREIDGADRRELRLDISDAEFIIMDLSIRNFTGMLYLRVSNTTFRPLMDIHTGPIQLLVAKNIILGSHRAARVILRNSVIFNGQFFRTIHAGYFDYRESHELITFGGSKTFMFLCKTREALLNVTITLDELEKIVQCESVGNITADDSRIIVNNEYICRSIDALGCEFYIARNPALIKCSMDNVFIRFLSPVSSGISSINGHANNLWMESRDCDQIKLIINGDLDALWPFGPAHFIISGNGMVPYLCIYDQRKPFIMDMIRIRHYCRFEKVTWNGHLLID